MKSVSERERGGQRREKKREENEGDTTSVVRASELETGSKQNKRY